MLGPKRRVGAREQPPPPPKEQETGKPLQLQAFLQFQRPLLTKPKLALTREVFPGPSYTLTKLTQTGGSEAR